MAAKYKHYCKSSSQNKCKKQTFVKNNYFIEDLIPLCINFFQNFKGRNINKYIY